MTRLIVLLLVAVLTVALVSAAVVDHDGEPGCKTPGEITQRTYRNNWDPTKYWLCSQINVGATLESCPTAQSYLTRLSKCVDVGDWEWTEPIEPPSRP